MWFKVGSCTTFSGWLLAIQSLKLDLKRSLLVAWKWPCTWLPPGGETVLSVFAGQSVSSGERLLGFPLTHQWIWHILHLSEPFAFLVLPCVSHSAFCLFWSHTGLGNTWYFKSEIYVHWHTGMFVCTKMQSYCCIVFKFCCSPVFFFKHIKIFSIECTVFTNGSFPNNFNTPYCPTVPKVTPVWCIKELALYLTGCCVLDGEEKLI